MKPGRVKIFYLLIITIIILVAVPFIRLIIITKEIHELKIGMKEFEIIQIIGEPDSRKQVSDETIKLIYNMDILKKPFGGTLFYIYLEVYIDINSGKVKNIVSSSWMT